MTKETQRSWVKKQLLKGRKLTQLQVTLERRILRLGAIIFYLRHDVGMKIKVDLRMGQDGGMYAVYFMTTEDRSEFKEKEEKKCKKN